MTVDVEDAEKECRHQRCKDDHESNPRNQEAPVCVGEGASRRMNQDGDISLEEGADIDCDKGEQLQGRLAASGVQQRGEPEAVLPTSGMQGRGSNLARHLCHCQPSLSARRT